MGIIVHDTIYCPKGINKAYVNLDPTFTIKKKKLNENLVYDVIAHYCCFKFQGDEKPFHKVEITLTDVKDLNNMYKELYTLIKSDFIDTTDVE